MDMLSCRVQLAFLTLVGDIADDIEFQFYEVADEFLLTPGANIAYSIAELHFS